MEERLRILCVDDEKNILKAIERLFFDSDYEILTAANTDEGIEILNKTGPIQIVLSDYKMPGKNGIDFLKEICQKWPDTVRIILSGYADTAAVVSAINEGQIYKFIPKPWNDDELKVTIANAFERYILHKKNVELNVELKKRNEELQEFNNNLERLVADRTAALTFQNKVLSISQNILYSLPIAILGIDLDGMIVHCNKKGIQLFGSDGKSVIGEQIKDLLNEEINNLVDGVIEKGILSGKINIKNCSTNVKGIFMKCFDAQEGIILTFDCEDRE